jgi:hypothetical protein
MVESMAICIFCLHCVLMFLRVIVVACISLCRERYSLLTKALLLDSE